MNTFVITHKGKTIYYNIERTINVLKSIGSSISEGKTLNVDGGMSVSVLAVAYKGSYATATLGGTTVELTESAKSDAVDINSSYAAFTGKITVPEGIVDEEQYLGNIEISASYAGYSRTYIGAEVIVNAVKLPDKNVEVIDEIPADQSSFGNGEVVGKLSAAVSDDTEVTYVKLNKNFAYIYDGTNTDSVILRMSDSYRKALLIITRVNGMNTMLPIPANVFSKRTQILSAVTEWVQIRLLSMQ